MSPQNAGPAWGTHCRHFDHLCHPSSTRLFMLGWSFNQLEPAEKTSWIHMCPPVDDLLYIWMWLITIVSVYTIVHNGGDHDNEDDIDDSWMVKVMNERCVLFALAATKSQTWLPVLSLEQVKTCENITTGRHVRVWCCRHRRLCGVGGGGGGSGGSENEAESGCFFCFCNWRCWKEKNRNRIDEEWRVVFLACRIPVPCCTHWTSLCERIGLLQYPCMLQYKITIDSRSNPCKREMSELG